MPGPQKRVRKLITINFAEHPTDPVANEALTKLRDVKGSFGEIWIGHTELLAVWYKCWLESQEGVAGEG